VLLFVATGDSICRVDTEAGTSSSSLTGSGAHCVAIDPLRPNTVYAGSRGRGVWRSEDGARTWKDCRLPANDVFSIAISPADGALYAGCEPSTLFVSRDEGRGWRELDALRTIPSARTWSFPPRPWTSHVRWIAPSPHDAGLLLVGIELGGVMRSEDGGETWADHRPGAKLDAHELAWHLRAPGRAYEAAGDGSAWSFDGGDTWTATDAGRDRNYVWALAVDPIDPDTWFVSAAPGPFHAHGDRPAQAELYRWRGEGPWQALEAVGDVMPYALAAANGALVAGYRNGRLEVSLDSGDTWRLLPLSGDPLPAIVAIAT
jgi:photosystem II stability/assembly factor-like uncharacterized protein